MVEWIEINLNVLMALPFCVSTLVVEWIEIRYRKDGKLFVGSLHPRGGVD